MKNEKRAVETKLAFADALKKLLHKKSLSKITISDLAKECDLNRNTFYYHFIDINDLLDWMLKKDTEEIRNSVCCSDNIETAIRLVLEYFDKNLYMVQRIHRSLGDEAVKNLIFDELEKLMFYTIDNTRQALALEIDSKFLEFLSNFYTEALIGMLIRQIKEVNKEDKETVFKNLLFMCYSSIPITLTEYAKGQFRHKTQ